jgi:hypothetical protein
VNGLDWNPFDNSASRCCRKKFTMTPAPGRFSAGHWVSSPIVRLPVRFVLTMEGMVARLVCGAASTDLCDFSRGQKYGPLCLALAGRSDFQKARDSLTLAG